jgi:probable rRNA maturation factor
MGARKTNIARRPPAPIRVEVRNAQRKVRLDAARFAGFAARACQACDQLPGKRPWPGAEILVTFVSDRAIAALHERFMAIKGPTDVITFQHGEIVISAETALRQAREYRSSLEAELQLYIVHGLLHLRGYDDQTGAQARRMQHLQEKILRRVS